MPAPTLSNQELLEKLEETRRELEALKREFSMYVDYVNARIHGINHQINSVRQQN